MRKILLVLITITITKVYSQPSGFVMTRVDYIERYKEEAIKEMLLNGIPASITLAQGMLESGNGNSPLATYANNHFGIKCHKGWNGPSFTLDDDSNNECFRKYSSVTESYSDHSNFIRTRRWYASLFALKITDYKGWAYGLKQAGYATHPRYAEMLIDIIEENDLTKYDKLAEIGTLIVPPFKAESQLPLAKENSRITKNNGLKCIVAKVGDSYESLSIDLSIHKNKLLRINEGDLNPAIKAGEFIYLEKKKLTAEVSYHIATQDQTIYEVAQIYGIGLKRLCKLNGIKKDSVLQQNERILLR